MPSSPDAIFLHQHCIPIISRRGSIDSFRFAHRQPFQRRQRRHRHQRIGSVPRSGNPAAGCASPDTVLSSRRSPFPSWRGSVAVKAFPSLISTSTSKPFANSNGRFRDFHRPAEVEPPSPSDHIKADDYRWRRYSANACNRLASADVAGNTGAECCG